MDPKAGKITFAQWFERWASAQVWATGTKLKAAMTIPTPEQLGEALKVAPDFFAPFISVCAFAGLRLGEAAGLQLGDVDFLRRTISVSRQIQGSTKTEAEVVPPKHGDRSGLFSWRKN
ncbi:hypothetical protein [Paenarthrobacter nicotinovorans]|uniref:hypothetical protein n=1 Tax=Paenarthrobacter nicotinovorans TaxID=29320 RepID=UPI0037491F45